MHELFSLGDMCTRTCQIDVIDIKRNDFLVEFNDFRGQKQSQEVAVHYPLVHVAKSIH